MIGRSKKLIKNKFVQVSIDCANVVDPEKAKEYGIYIYRIDLNNKNGKHINFYEDDTMEYDDAVFTYNNIPAECITLVDIIKL